jgi:hypothetical protein
MSGRKGKGGRDGVREGIEGAKVVPVRPAPEQAAEATPGAYLSDIARLFVRKDDGLYKIRPDGDCPDMFLCGPIDALCETRGEYGKNWGLLLRWWDPGGRQHEEVFPRMLFSNEDKEIRAILADHGLTLNAARHARAAFFEWLSLTTSDNLALIVTRTGWYRLDRGPGFVLLDRIVGETSENVVLPTVDVEPSFFKRGRHGRRCLVTGENGGDSARQD